MYTLIKKIEPKNMKECDNIKPYPANVENMVSS